MSSNIGIVAIGRNEGRRLELCLESLAATGCPIVYVDSGSTDGSVAAAKAAGAEVVELDTSIPFTAARARNQGFARLKEICPEITLVQFLDGDCSLDSQWLSKATKAMDAETDLAVVCGRRRERFPDRSIYNWLCDMEWDTPVGYASECGGDALMRVAAFEQVGGFNSDFIAGEEPELCGRLIAAKWKVRRIDAEMTMHDAALYRFTGWWWRNVRAGYAYALRVHTCGKGPKSKERRSCIVWGGLIPLVIIILIWPTHGWAIIGLLLYLMQWMRMALRREQYAKTMRQRALLAMFMLIAKFAEFWGVMMFSYGQLRGRQRRLIEYKSLESSSSALQAK